MCNEKDKDCYTVFIRKMELYVTSLFKLFRMQLY
ncbi:unnamed protein product [Haemonchus placei]|uniref:Uncharacterized protein n=1 Tax=Haemonchus placei TaxID=6290 RepID=A0A0N4VWP1_HAEPC|nr:unnamed protein product [Haemonchus placei]